jgi:hypothetical protein
MQPCNNSCPGEALSGLPLSTLGQQHFVQDLFGDHQSAADVLAHPRQAPACPPEEDTLLLPPDILADAFQEIFGCGPFDDGPDAHNFRPFVEDQEQLCLDPVSTPNLPQVDQHALVNTCAFNTQALSHVVGTAHNSELQVHQSAPLSGGMQVHVHVDDSLCGNELHRDARAMQDHSSVTRNDGSEQPVTGSQRPMPMQMVDDNEDADRKMMAGATGNKAGDISMLSGANRISQQTTGADLTFKPLDNFQVFSVVSSGTGRTGRSTPSSPSSSVSPLLQPTVDAHGWPADPASSSVTSPAFAMPVRSGSRSTSGPLGTLGDHENDQCSARRSRASRASAATHVRREGQLRKPRSAPRWCHVCARECTARPHIICDGVADQANRCSRFVCKTCYDLYGWDWNVAKEDDKWRCMHCRGTCPPVAQCYVKGGLPPSFDAQGLVGTDPRAAQTKRRYRSDIIQIAASPVD